jgi:hypothetical protein
MISDRELRRIAGRMGLGVGQCEHEYVMLCAIDALSHTEALVDTFCLKGGTALRLVYFADWRHSVDLDFSVLPTFAADGLRAGLVTWFRQVEVLHGVGLSVRDYHAVNGAARIRARFLGPLQHPGRLLFDVTLDESVLLSPQRRPVVIALFEDLHPTVLSYSLEEILAEKLRSILQRGKARDYYDVWRLLQEKADHFDPGVVRSIMVQKCAHKGLPPPEVMAFLDPALCANAGAFWSQDLSDQLPGVTLPVWIAVQEDLGHLLTGLLSIEPRGRA